MSSLPGPPSALAAHRSRLRDRGLQRVEVQAPVADAPLIRAVAAALTDPAQAEAARAFLRIRFAPVPARSLKDLLAAAPLEGIELDRPRDAGRDIDL
jgi:hypothetical protein